MLQRSCVLIVAALSVLSFSGCANLGENQQTGTIAGGLVGGLLGSQVGKGGGRTAAVMGGAVLGSLIGSSLGKNADDLNQMRLSRALDTTPLHHTRSWVDPNTGYQYTVRPMRRYHHHGHVCRRYKTSVMIDGRLQTATGQACRDARGHWQVH